MIVQHVQMFWVYMFCSKTQEASDAQPVKKQKAKKKPIEEVVSGMCII